MDMRLPPGVLENSIGAAAQGRQRAAMPAFSYAFQPIVDTSAGRIHAYEALVRGPHGEPAPSVLQAVAGDDKYRFDEASRVAAIALAARLQLPCRLNLNLLPQGLYEEADTIAATLAAAREHGLEPERLTLEVTEGEAIADYANLAQRLNRHRSDGLRFAIDDFGAGWCGLNLLADFQPDQVKIDMHLVRGIERHGPRQTIVRAIVQVCVDLGIDVVAEGVETAKEFGWLAEEGIHLFQGWYFARPGFETLPQVDLPARR